MIRKDQQGVHDSWAVFSTNHSAREMSTSEDAYGRSCSRLELVFEHDQAEEVEPGLGLFPVQESETSAQIDRSPVDQTKDTNLFIR